MSVRTSPADTWTALHHSDITSMLSTALVVEDGSGVSHDSCEWRHKGLNSLFYGVFSDWPPTKGALMATNVVIGLLTVLLWYSAARVHAEFGWRSFRTVGNDPAARNMLRTFYVLQARVCPMRCHEWSLTS